MKRYIVLFLLTLSLALGCCGCTGIDTENTRDLAGSLLQALEGLNKESIAPTNFATPVPNKTEDKAAGKLPVRTALNAPVATTQIEQQEDLVLWTNADFQADDIFHYEAEQIDNLYFESFLYDNFVFVEFCQFKGEYDQSEVLQVIADYMYVDAQSMDVIETTFDVYPAYRLSYPYGSNEDTQYCEDMAVLTDDALLLFHTQIYADYFDLYQNDILDWIEDLCIVPKEQERWTPEDVMSDAIVGWWVYMGERADAEFPIIWYFAEDGSVYLYPEAYYESLEGKDAFCCQWEIRDGKAIYSDIGAPGENPPVECEIQMDGDDIMTVCWPDGVTDPFMKTTTRQASDFLRKGEYAYLAQGPILCYVLFDADINEFSFSVLLDDVQWVGVDDTYLIKEYGLEDAFFDNDYELYNRHSVFEQQTVFKDGTTKYFVIDWSHGIAEKEVNWAEFAYILTQRGDTMLANVTWKDNYVSEIREQYVP